MPLSIPTGGTQKASVQIACFLFVVSIFVIDLFVPAGIAICIFYVLPVFIAGLTMTLLRSFVMALLCTGLTIVGYLASPSSPGVEWMASTNRLLSGHAIWIALLISWLATHLMLDHPPSNDGETQDER